MKKVRCPYCGNKHISQGCYWFYRWCDNCKIGWERNGDVEVMRKSLKERDVMMVASGLMMLEVPEGCLMVMDRWSWEEDWDKEVV
jgi:hypothetical protein